ncbi:MAG TPA: PqiC family protein [Candidatus Binataceae bacterium]|nr:PqiC family protein [Candidatus Binataceae bacterium]
MTFRSIACLLGIVAITVAMPGCGTSPASHFYSLDSAASPGNVPSTKAAILVGPVTIPDSVDRPEIVIRVAPNRVEVEEFDRWDAPLDDSIARAVAGDLAIQLGKATVTSAPLGNFNPDYRVSINVQNFESTRGRSALIDAVWTISKAGGASSGRTVARETVNGDSFEALAAAHSRALAKLSDDIAKAIRAQEQPNP